MRLESPQPLQIKEQIFLPLLQHDGTYRHDDSEGVSGIDLNDLLLRAPGKNSYCLAKGDELAEAGIFDGDILIVDHSLHPQHDQIVIASVNGDYLCRKLDLNNCQLTTADDLAPPISLSEEADCAILGVVIHSIHPMR